MTTSTPTTKSIPAVASSRTAAYKLYPNGATSTTEYFLVENRQKTGTDSALPGAGLLIWHVDETRNDWHDGYQNDTESHKLVDLEEAGGVQDLDTEIGLGGPDDPYPGTSNNRAFTDTTNPNAKVFAGLETESIASGVVVDQISNSGATMSARLAVSTKVTPTKVTLKLVGLTSGVVQLGRSVTTTGKVTPASLAGSKITLTVQKRRGTTWVTAKTGSATVRPTGTYSWLYKPAMRGARRLRATIAKSATHAAAATAWSTFRVK